LTVVIFTMATVGAVKFMMDHRTSFHSCSERCLNTEQLGV